MTVIPRSAQAAFSAFHCEKNRNCQNFRERIRSACCRRQRSRAAGSRPRMSASHSVQATPRCASLTAVNSA